MVKRKRKNNSGRKIRGIKKKRKIIEESTLEENLEDTEEIIGEEKFQEFFQQNDVSAPVLDQVEEVTQEPLEISLASVPVSEDTPKKFQINYSTREDSPEDGKKKYEGENIRYEIAKDVQDFAQERFQTPQETFITSPIQAQEKKNENMRFIGQRREFGEIDKEAYKTHD